MSLIKSMSTGISGLRSFQAKLNAIGNNIANVETSGFKSSRVAFSEVLSRNSGMGTRVSSINQNFTQGGYDSTGVKTDLALNGNGFFVMGSGDQTYLTRAGSFIFDKNGFLVDRAGRQVMGYNSENFRSASTSSDMTGIRVDFDRVMDPKVTQNVFIGGNISTASTFQQLLARTALTLSDGSMAQSTTRLNDLAQTTSAFEGGETITFGFTTNTGENLDIEVDIADANATLGDVITAVNAELEGEQARLRLQDGLLIVESMVPGASQLSVTSIDVAGGEGETSFPSFRLATQGINGTRAIEASVFDSKGTRHILVLQLTQTEKNEWEYEIRFNGSAQVLSDSTGTITFDDNGNIATNSTISLEFDPNNGASTQAFTINLGGNNENQGLTQFTGISTVTEQSQDGFGIGRLIDYNFDEFGNLIGLYSNDQEVLLAKLAIGDVKNYDGLRSSMDGLFMASDESGAITFSTASERLDVRLLAGTLESSNVDLTREFTDMITAQRAFQSNARVVSTSDEILNETVNLKR